MANASGSGFFTLSVVRVRPLTWKVACFGSIAERHHVRKGCKLVGCGSAVPSLEISNDDLSKIVDISDERKRRVHAGRDRSLISLAVEAAKIAKQLGCTTNPLSYDITAACSGFLLGLVSSACHIRGGGFNNVLVIGADAISRYVDWTDRGSCILFGDAAGAVPVQACNNEENGLFLRKGPHIHALK